MKAALLAGAFWALAAPLSPLLAHQGRRARANTPRFAPPAGEPCGSAGAAEPPLRLLVTGESTAAGVGALTHREGLGAQIAQALAKRLGRRVAWRALGHPGQVAAEVLSWAQAHLPAEPADVALIVLGVNDAVRVTPLRRWEDDLRRLTALVAERTSAPLVALSEAPPMHRFPGLPVPLSWALGLRARALAAAQRELARSEPGLVFVPVLRPMPYDFCEDRYHPGGAGYAAWGALTAHHLADALLASGADAQVPRRSTSAT